MCILTRMETVVGSGSSEQATRNNEVWGSADFVGGYATRALRPVEVMLLARYRDSLSKRVLDIGCGAGRVTGYFVQLGGDVLGIDLSPRMVEFCRRRYPAAEFRVGDLARLEGVERSSFDVVFVGNNLIDVLGDPERRAVLAELGTLLDPDGLLMVSSHNRAHAPSIPGVLQAARMAGIVEALHRIPRVPWWILNRRRLRRYEIREEGYAVLNDEAHDFRLLHYYIGRDGQERQLDDGYELLECLDEDGNEVGPGEEAAAHGELHYVARLAPPAAGSGA